MIYNNVPAADNTENISKFIVWRINITAGFVALLSLLSIFLFYYASTQPSMFGMSFIYLFFIPIPALGLLISFQLFKKRTYYYFLSLVGFSILIPDAWSFANGNLIVTAVFVLGFLLTLQGLFASVSFNKKQSNKKKRPVFGIVFDIIVTLAFVYMALSIIGPLAASYYYQYRVWSGALEKSITPNQDVADFLKEARAYGYKAEIAQMADEQYKVYPSYRAIYLTDPKSQKQLIIKVTSYNTTEELERAASLIPRDGIYVGETTGTLFGVDSNYFKKGGMMFVYEGSDKGVLSFLESIAGKEFAGANVNSR